MDQSHNYSLRKTILNEDEKFRLPKKLFFPKNRKRTLRSSRQAFSAVETNQCQMESFNPAVKANNKFKEQRKLEPLRFLNYKSKPSAIELKNLPFSKNFLDTSGRMCLEQHSKDTIQFQSLRKNWSTHQAKTSSITSLKLSIQNEK